MDYLLWWVLHWQLEAVSNKPSRTNICTCMYQSLSVFICCNQTFSWNGWKCTSALTYFRILWGDPGKVQMGLKTRRTEHTWQERAHVNQIWQKDRKAKGEKRVDVTWRVQENNQLNTKYKRNGFFSDSRLLGHLIKANERWGQHCNFNVINRSHTGTCLRFSSKNHLLSVHTWIYKITTASSFQYSPVIAYRKVGLYMETLMCGSRHTHTQCFESTNTMKLFRNSSFEVKTSTQASHLLSSGWSGS